MMMCSHHVAHLMVFLAEVRTAILLRGMCGVRVKRGRVEDSGEPVACACKES